MYCVKCGVALADSERKCPLCGTPVFHPDIARPAAEPPFPPERRLHGEAVNRSGLLFVLTIFSLLPVLIVLLCDWRINGGVVWSGFAAGGIVLFYILVLLPQWFRRPNPVIFVPVDFAAIALYLLYIDFAVGGHWFLSFAFPVTGAIALLVTAVITLVRYLHGGYLYIFWRRADPERLPCTAGRVSAESDVPDPRNLLLVVLPACRRRAAWSGADHHRHLQAAARVAAPEIFLLNICKQMPAPHGAGILPPAACAAAPLCKGRCQP